MKDSTYEKKIQLNLPKLYELLASNDLKHHADEIRLKKKHSYPIGRAYNRAINALSNKLALDNVVGPIRKESKFKIWISVPHLPQSTDNEAWKRSQDPSLTAILIKDRLTTYLNTLSKDENYSCLMLRESIEVVIFDKINDDYSDTLGDWQGWGNEIIQAFIYIEGVPLTHDFIEITINR